MINDRNNIICFSDEAHRTQLEHSKKIQFSKDADDNMKAPSRVQPLSVLQVRRLQKPIKPSVMKLTVTQWIRLLPTD